MPKNYLEQILLYLEQLNDKDEVKEFLIKSKPYLEMDNIEYLNQIIDGINEYINTYSELDSNKDVISLENLKKICLDIMDEYKNMSEKEENEFPCLDGKGRFKVFFEGFSYGDFKALSKNDVNNVLKNIQNELANELILRDVEPVNHTNAIYYTKFLKKKLNDLGIYFYRENDYAIIIGVKRNQGLNTDYTRYDAVAKSLPAIEMNLRKYSKGILGDDTCHYRTVNYLKGILSNENEKDNDIVDAKDEDSNQVVKDEDTKENSSDDVTKSRNEVAITPVVLQEGPKKYFQWDTITDSAKELLGKEFIRNYTIVLDYYKEYGDINNLTPNKEDLDSLVIRKQTIREILKPWKRGVFRRNAGVLQISLLEDIGFDFGRTIDNKQSNGDNTHLLEPIVVGDVTKHEEDVNDITYIDRVIDILLSYYEDYGNVDIPVDYKLLETGFPLGRAIDEIREEFAKGRLSEEQIQRLRDMNFNFEFDNDKKNGAVTFEEINEIKDEPYQTHDDEYKNNIKKRLFMKLIDRLDGDNIDEAIRVLDGLVNGNYEYDNNIPNKTL